MLSLPRCLRSRAPVAKCRGAFLHWCLMYRGISHSSRRVGCFWLLRVLALWGRARGFWGWTQAAEGKCFDSRLYGKIIPAKRARSETGAAERIGDGGRTSECVVAWGQQSLVSPALLYFLFKGILSSGGSLNAVKQVGHLLCVVHRLLQWEVAEKVDLMGACFELCLFVYPQEMLKIVPSCLITLVCCLCMEDVWWYGPANSLMLPSAWNWVVEGIADIEGFWVSTSGFELFIWSLARLKTLWFRGERGVL